MWISQTFRCVTQNPCRAPLNPERGFLVESETRASNYKPLTFNQFEEWRAGEYCATSIRRYQEYEIYPQKARISCYFGSHEVHKVIYCFR